MQNENFDEKKMSMQEKDTERKKAKAKGKVKGKAFFAIIFAALKIMLKILLILSVAVIVYSAVQWVLEKIRAERTPEATTEIFDVENLEELVEIKGNETSGYYLAYVKDFDKKLDELVVKISREQNLKNISEELLEKMIRTELVTQYPNLGGTLGSNTTNSANIDLMLQKAKEIAEYVKNNNYTYGDAAQNPAINKTEKVISCDRFVGWVLYEMGYTEQPSTKGLPLIALEEFLENIGWEKIENSDEYRAGDIIFTRPRIQGNSKQAQHVFICAGQGSSLNTYLRYDIGSQSRIDSNQPFEEPITEFTYLYRASSQSASNGLLHWPAPTSTTITSPFGPRNIAYGSSNHGGIDIGQFTGDNIEAAAPGTVIYSGWDSGGGGLYINIDHGNGYTTQYLHCSELIAKEGDVVNSGDVIAKVGGSGPSGMTHYDPHLHFQIKINDEKVNPLDFKYDNEMGDGKRNYEGTITTAASNVTLEGFLIIGDTIAQGLKEKGDLGENITYKTIEKTTPNMWLKDSYSTILNEIEYTVEEETSLYKDVKDKLDNKDDEKISIVEDANIETGKTFSTLPKNSDEITGVSISLGAYAPKEIEEMKKLIKKVHNRYPDKKIYVQKVLSIESNEDNIKQSIKNFNDEIQQFCKTTKYAVFIDSTKNVELSNNGIIPTDEGYKTLSENMKNLVIRNIEGLGEYDGFQGNIKIRRVTPNKAMGSTTDITGGEISVETSNESETSDNNSIEAGTNLESEVKTYINNKAAPGTWSVYAKNLSSKEVEINVNNKKMQSASLIKLFILATVYEEKSKGEAKDISSNDIKIMITQSDNGATNRIIDALGYEKINKYIKDNGYNNTEIKRKMLESNSNGDNYTSVEDVGKLLEKIYNNECVNSESSKQMLAYLKEQTRISKIPAGVPSGVQTANKTGELDTVENDAAIIYKENTPYILVVITSGLSDTAKARSNIKEISSTVYDKIGSEEDNENKENNEKHIIAIDAGHGDSKYAGDYDELATSKEDLDNNKKYYTTGTSGKIDGVDTSEAVAVQRVVDKVKTIMAEKYPNIEVVQTGKDKPNFQRIDLAKEANAEAYIGVHLNSGGGNGTYIYTRSDPGQETLSFADIFLNSVSTSLGLAKNSVVSSDEHTNTGLQTYSQCGIPAIYIEGGFMDSQTDMAVLGSDNGLTKYAEGIVEGIAEYFKVSSSSSSSSSSNTKTTTSTSVNSKVYDLSYVPQDIFDKYVEQNNIQAINTYTLDEKGRLITAKWAYISSEGIKIIKNSPIEFKTIMQKYTTTYEYLLDYLIDIKEEEFVGAFADLALDSEFIITIQDNVSTTSTQKITNQTVIVDGAITSSGQIGNETTIYETVQNAIELTYADTWFVRFQKEFSFANINLQSSTNVGTTLSGQSGQLLGSFKITGYCPCGECSGPWGRQTSTGATCTANRTIATDQSVIPAGTKVIIEGNPYVYVAEDVGGGVKGNHIDVFVDTHSETFGSTVNGDKNVYLAEGVTEGNASMQLSNQGSGLINNAITNVMGKVTITESNSSSTTSVDGTTTIGEKIVPKTIVTTINTLTRTISNKYETGEAIVQSKEEEFIELFDQYPDAKTWLKPKWLVGLVEQNASEMTDLTKYLMNKLFGEKIFKNINKDAIFKKYKENEFAKISSLAGNTIQEKVWIALRKMGYSEYATAGAMGNIHYESAGFNPSTIESGSGWGIGICQWTNPNGGSIGRRQQLEDYAKSKGKEWKDENIQVEFLVAELTQGGGADGYASYQLMSNNGYSPNQWINASNVEDATKAFCWTFERPNISDGNSSMSERIAAAQKYYDEFSGRDLSTFGGGNGDVLESCERVMNMYLERGTSYSLAFASNGLTSGNIKKSYESDNRICCATYVSAVLYDAGILTEEQINPYAYNYTGSSGIPDMLAAAGYVKVPIEQAQPGDIINKYGIHVLIYGGGDIMWDQTSVTSRLLGPRHDWNSYKNSGVQIWHKD